MASWKSKSFLNTMRFKRKNLHICQDISRILVWCKRGLNEAYFARIPKGGQVFSVIQLVKTLKDGEKVGRKWYMDNDINRQVILENYYPDLLYLFILTSSLSSLGHWDCKRPNILAFPIITLAFATFDVVSPCSSLPVITGRVINHVECPFWRLEIRL